MAADNGVRTAWQSLLGNLAMIKGHGLEKFWTETEVFRCRGGNQQLATMLAALTLSPLVRGKALGPRRHDANANALGAQRVGEAQDEGACGITVVAREIMGQEQYVHSSGTGVVRTAHFIQASAKLVTIFSGGGRKMSRIQPKCVAVHHSANSAIAPPASRRAAAAVASASASWCATSEWTPGE